MRWPAPCWPNRSIEPSPSSPDRLIIGI